MSITEPAMGALLDYHWPGNIRELENVLERAAVLCESNSIRLSDLPLLIKDKTNQNVLDIDEDSMDLNQTLEAVEKKLIEKAMDKAKGIKTEAAKLLQIKTSALYYKLEKYRLI